MRVLACEGPVGDAARADLRAAIEACGAFAPAEAYAQALPLPLPPYCCPYTYPYCTLPLLTTAAVWRGNGMEGGGG